MKFKDVDIPKALLGDPIEGMVIPGPVIIETEDEPALAGWFQIVETDDGETIVTYEDDVPMTKFIPEDWDVSVVGDEIIGTSKSRNVQYTIRAVDESDKDWIVNNYFWADKEDPFDVIMEDVTQHVAGFRPEASGA